MPDAFTYWHVELDTHALLLAEGCAVESFLEGIEPIAFDNAAERLAPADGRKCPIRAASRPARCRAPSSAGWRRGWRPDRCAAAAASPRRQHPRPLLRQLEQTDSATLAHMPVGLRDWAMGSDQRELV